jgi:KH domain
MSRNRPIDRERVPDAAYYLKLLLVDKCSSAMIGKGGTAIQDLERKTGSNVKLSPYGCLYPTTQDRALCISADSRAAIEDVVRYVLDLQNRNGVINLRILAPEYKVSAIIGKGGDSIRHICVNHSVNIKISDKNDALCERIIDVRGKESDILSAIMVLVDKIQDDRIPGSEYTSVTYQIPDDILQANAREPLNITGVQEKATRTGRDFEPLPTKKVETRPQVIPPPIEVLCYPMSLEFFVPADIVPPVNILSEISRSSGADVTVRSTGDVDNIVTIAGPLASVQAAHILVIKEVAKAF